MSHGPSDSKCEPNLVPMLDLVLQLVMFFMVCANFVQEQTDVDIKLPKSITAKMIEKGEDYVIYLNVNTAGDVILPPLERYTDSTGNETKSLTTPTQVEIYLKRKAKEDEARAGPANKDKSERSVIVLRVHEACPFEKTYGIMKACRIAGYKRVQLRAERAAEGG